VDYIRYNIKTPEAMTSIQNEIQMLKSYIDVFGLQYGDRIRLKIEIPDD